MTQAARRVFLASSSPQRFRMLKALEMNFSVISPDIDETPRADETPRDYVLRLAVQKSSEAMQRIPERADDCITVGADTCVSINERKLGKPESRLEARRMLELLSGEIHQVHSAVAVTCGRITRCAAAVSDVEFIRLTEAQIDTYLASGESENRAGAYAIQGIAASFVKRIAGSLSSVVGMPVKETAELLGLAGVAVPAYPRIASRVLAEFSLGGRSWPDDYYI